MRRITGKVQLRLSFTSGKRAALAADEEQIDTIIKTLGDGGTVNIHTMTNPGFEGPEGPMTIICTVRGSTVTHMMVLPLMMDDDADGETEAKLLAPAGF